MKFTLEKSKETISLADNPAYHSNEQKKELEIILENISDQIILVNLNGEYTYMNKATVNNPIFDFEKLKNNKDTFANGEYFDKNGDSILFENTPIQKVLRGEKVKNYILVETNSNGTIYTEVTGNPIYDNSNNLVGGVLIYHDIGERLKIEEYALINRKIKILAFSYISLSYPDFNIIYINDNANKLIQKSYFKTESMPSLIGSYYFKYYRISKEEESSLINNIKNSIDNDSDSYDHTQKFIIDGEEKYYKTIFQPIVGINHQIEKIISIGIDITKEENAKIQLAKTLQFQEEMLVNVSHELKTPLNVIFSASQLLEFYLQGNSQQGFNDVVSKYNYMIKQNCFRLTKLINNILDISKIESGYFRLNLVNKDIVNIIKRIVGSVCEYYMENGYRIKFSTNIKEKFIACDPYKIERIMLNLISNAIKFSPLDENIYVSIFDKGPTIEISVMDTGIGIDVDNQKIIFEKFRQVDKSLTRNCEGTGIGLSLVKSLVELHKGTINVESTLGQGSIFKIELPAILVENPSTAMDNNNNNNDDIIEMIKLELSDIY